MSECIEYQGYCNRDGYGVVSQGRKNPKILAHRKAWADANGPIPEGVCILHKCDNPPCINVEHLFLGTQADNVADMNAKGRNPYKRKTHCPKGHPYSGENLLLAPKGGRKCRACIKARWQPKSTTGGRPTPPEVVEDIQRSVVFGRGGNVVELALKHGVTISTVRRLAARKATS